MPAPIIPWEPCVFPTEICDELDRRKINRSFVYTAAEKGGWDETNGSQGDWRKYRGPTSPWVRFCSNGRGKATKQGGKYGKSYQDYLKEGFVFFSGKDFYSGYGFNNTEGNPSIIGYVPSKQGGIHTISNDMNSNYPIHVPAPEIEKINVTIQKELYRRASVEWVCFSKAQLEYMTPYFLVPGISCILEWGWNNYNPTSLIDLTDTTLLKKRFNNPYPLYTKNILQSKGNYDVLFGIITHFEWSIEGNKIKCKTEITSKDRIYAGILTESNIVVEKKDVKEVEEPLTDLKKFVTDILPKFAEVNVNTPPNFSTIPLLQEFRGYLEFKHPDTWKDYAYGIFYGRDMKDDKNPFNSGISNKDFDKGGGKKDLWINLGLAMEVINFHSFPLELVRGKEIFRVDIDDVVISGHPNLISTKGDVCLIPNAEAPKYFFGYYGESGKNPPTHEEYMSKMQNSTWAMPWVDVIRDKIEKKNKRLADYRLLKLCKPFGDNICRDNLDELINYIRYSIGGTTTNTTTKYRNKTNTTTNTNKSRFAFPFLTTTPDSVSKDRAHYSGYLKNIYINTNMLVTILKEESVKTYVKFTEKILEEINKACGNFWEFRLVEGTGKDGLDEGEIATMKVIDYKFMYTDNRGKVYTFDYYDADSLLQGLSFKPTISNAQAIRSIYAPTNNPNRKNSITNGTNELLDYQFQDRLFVADETKESRAHVNKSTEGFDDTMRSLQDMNASLSHCQMTTVIGGNKNKKLEEVTPSIPLLASNIILQQESVVYIGDVNKNIEIANTKVATTAGTIIVRRLVLPAPEILSLLLDDGDEENNPKYTGVMPGIQATFTIQGIGGLRTFMMFLVRNLPEPYSHMNIVFRIVDVQETVESGKWITNITAGIVPLRDYIKTRLGINPKQI